MLPGVNWGKASICEVRQPILSCHKPCHSCVHFSGKLSAEPSSWASLPVTFTGKEPQKMSVKKPNLCLPPLLLSESPPLGIPLPVCEWAWCWAVPGRSFLEKVSVGKGRSEVGEPPGASRARDISGHRLALFLFCLIFLFSKDLCLLQVDGNAVSEEGGTLGTHYPFI